MSEYPGLPPLAYFMHLLQASHLCYMVPVVLFFSITIGLQDAQGFGRNVTNKLSLLLTLVCVWALALVGEFITLRWLGQLLFWSATLTLDDQDPAAKLLRSVEVLLLVLAVLVVFTGWLVTIAVGCEKIRELWRELRIFEYMAKRVEKRMDRPQMRLIGITLPPTFQSKNAKLFPPTGHVSSGRFLPSLRLFLNAGAGLMICKMHAYAKFVSMIAIRDMNGPRYDSCSDQLWRGFRSPPPARTGPRSNRLCTLSQVVLCFTAVVLVAILDQHAPDCQRSLSTARPLHLLDTTLFGEGLILKRCSCGLVEKKFETRGCDGQFWQFFGASWLLQPTSPFALNRSEAAKQVSSREKLHVDPTAAANTEGIRLHATAAYVEHDEAVTIIAPDSALVVPRAHDDLLVLRIIPWAPLPSDGWIVRHDGDVCKGWWPTGLVVRAIFEGRS
ncbi:hypothetical protein JHW43_005815 [Diplocarpon mali]|nr:hypothetical protein JHW43_005815 [Diplocarpon mali]